MLRYEQKVKQTMFLSEQHEQAVLKVTTSLQSAVVQL